MVAGPGSSPCRVAVALCVPSGNVIVGVATPTRAGSSLSRLTTTPPAGAGAPRVIGNDAVCPNGTFSVAGMPIILSVTSMLRVPSRYPSALPRTVVVPVVTPSTMMLPLVSPSGIVTDPGSPMASTPGLSLVTVTTTPPASAGCESVTCSSATRLTPTTCAPSSATPMAGMGVSAVALNRVGWAPKVANASCSPNCDPRVHAVRARPAESETLVVGLTVPSGVLHVTSTPGTGLANSSRTSTTSESASVSSTSPVCSSPPTRASTTAGPGSAVAANVTLSSVPWSAAMTKCSPAVVPSV